MAKPTITGTKNDVSVAGQTLTIVLGENGELTVAYVYDKYDLTGTDSVSNSTYNVEDVNGKYQAGADVTLKLTQKTGANPVSYTHLDVYKRQDYMPLDIVQTGYPPKCWRFPHIWQLSTAP